MRRYENTWFKLAALVLTLVLIVPILAACGGGGDNSFEEERAEVVQYLQGYNNITSSLSATLQGIDTPSSYWTVADILALKTALSQALTAVDGAMSRLNDLQPPSGVSEAVKHHQQAKTALTGLRQIFYAVQQSISSGNEAQLQQELVSINAALASVGSIDKTTEQLLLTYNIPDTEVNYQNRGK